MSNARIFMLSTMAAIALAAQPVMAHGFDGGENCRHGQFNMHGDDMGMRILNRLADRLDLSQVQRQALEAIADKHRSDLRQLRDSISDNGRALRKAQADDPRLPELALAQGKAISDMIVLRKQIRAEVDNVLTAEQREKLRMLWYGAWQQKRGHSHRNDG